MFGIKYRNFGTPQDEGLRNAIGNGDLMAAKAAVAKGAKVNGNDDVSKA